MALTEEQLRNVGNRLKEGRTEIEIRRSSFREPSKENIEKLKSKKSKEKKPKHLTYKKVSVIKKLGLPSYSSTHLLKKMASQNERLVREEPAREQREIPQDRSLFFNEEFRSEEKKDRSWFLK